MRALVPLLVLLLASGCTLFTRDAARALADAEARTARGDYPAALAAYDAYLTLFPEDEGAVRARAIRALMGELLAARAELAALRTRDGAELSRLRHELNARQAEVTRLREDLEALKRTDLQMERKRR